MRKLNHPEDTWRMSGRPKDFATDLATCLEALDLLPKSKG
jgi:hypothetical protein